MARSLASPRQFGCAFSLAFADAEIVRMALAGLDWHRDDPRWHGMLMRVLGAHPVAERERFYTCLRLMLQRCDPSVRGGS